LLIFSEVTGKPDQYQGIRKNTVFALKIPRWVTTVPVRFRSQAPQFSLLFSPPGSQNQITDSAHAYAHNKVMVIDEETVITSSFNFTNSAENKNAENLLVIKDKGIAMKYAENWKEHTKHSPLHKGRPIQGPTK
jgi:phosphatidylserine/phosphatidylglycerophosphate/cardiolipin synthase-like enzyme